MTREAISDAIDTGLFSSRGPGLVGFAHRTFAEFLTASHLAARAAPVQIIRLITVPAGGRVIPQLREVAAWMASLVPAIESAPVIPAVSYAAHGDPDRSRLYVRNRNHPFVAFRSAKGWHRRRVR